MKLYPIKMLASERGEVTYQIPHLLNRKASICLHFMVAYLIFIEIGKESKSDLLE